MGLGARVLRGVVRVGRVEDRSGHGT
jgi:hypothetical protein